ncbi:hypothetical protein V8G54_024729 [Vigna mungo]|uniref:Uncharacterized protein n=1 Tax=Vigna mungo TaxID=3915 RepID=A0AAQ3N627_VIGMU
MVRLLRPGSSPAKDGASGFFLQWRSLVFVLLPLPSIWFNAGEMRKVATLFCGLCGLAACLRSTPTMDPHRFLRSVMDKPISFCHGCCDEPAAEFAFVSPVFRSNSGVCVFPNPQIRFHWNPLLPKCRSFRK